MNVEFISDEYLEYKGFSAHIHFTPFPNKECEYWLDMDKKIFKSPNYPQTYQNTKICHWLITGHHDSHLSLNFIELYVRLSNNCDFYYCFSKYLFNFKYRWMLILISLQYMREEVNKLK